MKTLSSLCLTTLLFQVNLFTVHCGDVTIGFSPSAFRFGQADALHISDLDDLFATALGYTPEDLTWPGLTITSAFKYPSALVVFGVKDAGVPVKLEGSSYELKEDIPFSDSYTSLTSLIATRAQRPIHFEKINSLDLGKRFSHPVPVADTVSLDANKLMDSLFLQQMSMLPSLADYLDPVSTVNHKGQDVIYVDVDSFSPLVKEYGTDSPQVKEASEMLRNALEQTVYQLRSFYKDRLIVATAMLDQEKIHIRRARETLIGDSPKEDVDYNLASVYTSDFPVVFNIVLILSVILIVSVLAAALSMAYMDPGRDSIIYRMTNPRMKKDQ